MSDMGPKIDWAALRLGALAAAHRSEQIEAQPTVSGEVDRMLTYAPWRREAVLEREARLRAASKVAA